MKSVMKIMAFGLATLCYANVASALDICVSAAENFAEATAGVKDGSDVQCGTLAPISEVAPNEYGVSLICHSGMGGGRISLKYIVQTQLDSIRSPKTGKIYYSCRGISAQKE